MRAERAFWIEIRAQSPRIVEVMKDADYNEDCKWMLQALEVARQAGQAQEVPVGAVVVADGQLVAVGANARQWGLDPLGHAEIIAIRAAAEKLGSRYLNGCSLYVTLEPCSMSPEARTELLTFPHEFIWGASGFIASIMAKTGGSSSHSISIKSNASSAT